MFTGNPQGAVQIAQGTPLQILSRKDMTLIPATVTNVSKPHVPKEAQNNPTIMWQGPVVDLTLQMGNESTTIEYPVNGPSASYPKQGWFISPDPIVVSRELESMEKVSDQALATVPWHQLVKERAPQLALQLDAGKRKEAQQAQEIAMLRAQNEEMARRSSEIESKLDRMLEMFSAGRPANAKKKEE